MNDQALTELDLFERWCYGEGRGPGNEYHALDAIRRYRMFKAEMLRKREQEKKDA